MTVLNLVIGFLCIMVGFHEFDGQFENAFVLAIGFLNFAVAFSKR